MLEFPQMPPDMKAAQAFLEHPDRHTNAELELARQRANEAMRLYCEQIAPLWRQIVQAFQAYQPVITTITRTLVDAFGLSDPPTTAYLSQHPHKRALLRAARQQAHQSVQARHMRRSKQRLAGPL